MQLILLTQHKYSLVDDKDFDYLNQWKWHYKRGYAIRYDTKRKKWIFMHRIILTPPDGFETDHINNNPLDNRRSNLRMVTHQQNIMNQKVSKNNTSGYKGVYWDRVKRKWRVQLSFKGKHIYNGFYKNKLKAAQAYNELARKYHREYANLNFIS